MMMSKSAIKFLCPSVKLMLTLGQALVFSIVLFFYLHIHYHLKTSNDLEVYELANPSKETLEEVCGLRQPTRVNFSPTLLSSRLTSMEDTYGAFDVRVRDMSAPLEEGEDPYVQLPLSNVLRALEHDTSSRYISEANSSFLAETGIAKTFSAEDPYLRPYMVARRTYDVLAGSAGACTQFRRELYNRTYFIAISGTVSVKLAPPRADRYLYPVYDYCNYELRSPVDPWEPQSFYQADFAKVKCLDVALQPGQALFVPAYWWYSIKFSTPKDRLASCRYSSYMSALATLNHTLMWALQSQNMKHTIPTERPGEEMPVGPVVSPTKCTPKQENRDAVEVEPSHPPPTAQESEATTEGLAEQDLPHAPAPP